jgi:hypothetical protein
LRKSHANLLYMVTILWDFQTEIQKKIGLNSRLFNLK